ncbi:MAG: hypothetical protein JSW33_04305 [bacterium]|nr:MAG: hypothetical protein JSW33_04305 [bacterium]
MNRVKSPQVLFLILPSMLLLLAILTALSSHQPDGLENIIQRFQGDQKSGVTVSTPLSDYVMNMDFDPWLNQFLSAMLGMGIILIIFSVINGVISAKTKRDQPENAT